MNIDVPLLEVSVFHQHQATIQALLQGRLVLSFCRQQQYDNDILMQPEIKLKKIICKM